MLQGWEGVRNKALRLPDSGYRAGFGAASEIAARLKSQSTWLRKRSRSSASLAGDWLKKTLRSYNILIVLCCRARVGILDIWYCRNLTAVYYATLAE